MSRAPLNFSLVLAIALVVLSTAFPIAAQGAPTYATTSVTQSAMKKTVLGGISVVQVNYTSSFSASFNSFVYLDLVNSAGQSVYVSIGTCGFSASQAVSCYVALSSSIPAGSYTARVFATTQTNVPVSVTSSIQLTV